MLVLGAVCFPAAAQDNQTPGKLSPEILRELEHQAREEMQQRRRAAEEMSKALSLELALDLARAALAECRSKGQNVSVAVADASYHQRVLLRDDRATLRSFALLEKKLRLTIGRGKASSQVLTEDDKRLRSIGTNGMSPRAMEELAGAVPVKIKGALLGAVAVAGAETAAQDEKCAEAAVVSIAGDTE
jgi:uncharacterized protein GlcG (DUF336 family)